MKIDNDKTIITKPPIAADASLNAGLFNQCDAKGGAETLGEFNLDKNFRLKSGGSSAEG